MTQSQFTFSNPASPFVLTVLDTTTNGVHLAESNTTLTISNPIITPPPTTGGPTSGNVVVNPGGAVQADGTVVPAGSTGTIVAGPKVMNGINSVNVSFKASQYNGWTPVNSLSAVGTTPPVDPPPVDPPPVDPPPVDPPPTTGPTVKISPTGGSDNANVTAKIQAAIKAGVSAEFTAGTYLFDPYTFNASVSAHIIIDSGVVWHDHSIFGQTQRMITISSGFNGSITGALLNISMPLNYANAKKEVANGKDYEYQHAFCFDGTDGTVTLGPIHILNAAGDGVNFNSVAASAKVTLNSVVSDTDIRQGWSVTGKSVGSVILNNCGANNGPLTGFDFEPDNPGNSVTNFVFNNFSTSNNTGGGMSFGFMNLGGSDTVGVKVNGYTSTHEGTGAVGFWNNNSGTNTNAKGSVTMNNFNISNCQYDATYGRKSTDGWKMVFTNGVITNPNTGGNWAHYDTNAAIGVGLFGGESGTPGGVSWDNIKITSNSAATDFGNAKQVTVTNSTYNGKPLSFSS